MAASVTAPVYTLEILRLAASLDAPAALPREDGRAEARSPTCGSTIATAVMLDEAGRVAAMTQRVSACAFGQASAALVANAAAGKSREEIAAGHEAIAGWLGGMSDQPAWPEFAVLAPARARTGRHGAILLPFRALLAALDAA